MAAKIKKGDTVIITTGKSKGHKGEVLVVDKTKNKVIVGGGNIYIKHVAPSAKYPDGGRINKECPIHVSNVAIVDPQTGSATRVGFKIADDGKKYRYSKKSGERIE